MALRKALKLKKTPTGVRRTCKVTDRVNAKCSVRWSGGGQSVRGTVWIRFVVGSKTNNWTYRVDVRRTKNGHTSRIRQSFRTGGRLS